MKKNESNQQKLNSEFQNHVHENTKRIEDLSFHLTAGLNVTEEKIEELATNITNQITLLGSQIQENVTYISSDITKVSSIIYNIMNISLSSEFITIETNAKNAFRGFIEPLKPLSRNETFEKSVLAFENALKPLSSVFFGTKSIGLWDMGGKYPAGKVKNVFFISNII